MYPHLYHLQAQQSDHCQTLRRYADHYRRGQVTTYRQGKRRQRSLVALVLMLLSH